jgi:hypothetical protein
MTSETDTEVRERERSLDAEVRSLQKRLEQRELALGMLNRRLLQLERGDTGFAGMDRAAGGADPAEVQALRAELDRVYNTKLFRWASPARTIYGALRRLR